MTQRAILVIGFVLLASLASSLNVLNVHIGENALSGSPLFSAWKKTRSLYYKILVTETSGDVLATATMKVYPGKSDRRSRDFTFVGLPKMFDLYVMLWEKIDNRDIEIAIGTIPSDQMTIRAKDHSVYIPVETAVELEAQSDSSGPFPMRVQVQTTFGIFADGRNDNSETPTKATATSTLRTPVKSKVELPVSMPSPQVQVRADDFQACSMLLSRGRIAWHILLRASSRSLFLAPKTDCSFVLANSRDELTITAKLGWNSHKSKVEVSQFDWGFNVFPMAVSEEGVEKTQLVFKQKFNGNNIVPSCMTKSTHLLVSIRYGKSSELYNCLTFHYSYQLSHVTVRRGRGRHLLGASLAVDGNTFEDSCDPDETDDYRHLIEMQTLPSSAAKLGYVTDAAPDDDSTQSEEAEADIELSSSADGLVNREADMDRAQGTDLNEGNGNGVVPLSEPDRLAMIVFEQEEERIRLEEIRERERQEQEEREEQKRRTQQEDEELQKALLLSLQPSDQPQPTVLTEIVVVTQPAARQDTTAAQESELEQVFDSEEEDRNANVNAGSDSTSPSKLVPDGAVLEAPKMTSPAMARSPDSQKQLSSRHSSPVSLPPPLFIHDFDDDLSQEQEAPSRNEQDLSIPLKEEEKSKEQTMTGYIAGISGAGVGVLCGAIGGLVYIRKRRARRRAAAIEKDAVYVDAPVVPKIASVSAAATPEHDPIYDHVPIGSDCSSLADSV